MLTQGLSVLHCPSPASTFYLNSVFHQHFSWAAPGMMPLSSCHPGQERARQLLLLPRNSSVPAGGPKQHVKPGKELRSPDAPCLVGRKGLSLVTALKTFLALEPPLLPTSHLDEHLPVTQTCQNLSRLQASACLFTETAKCSLSESHGWLLSPPQGPPLTYLQSYPSFSIPCFIFFTALFENYIHIIFLR